MKPSKRLDPIHPGEVLLEDFMRPLKMKPDDTATASETPTRRVLTTDLPSSLQENPFRAGSRQTADPSAACGTPESGAHGR